MSREQIVELYLQGGMSRRTFVRRMVAAGLTVSAAVTYAELLHPSGAQADTGTDIYANDAVLPPDVVTGLPTALLTTSATLHATVDPNFHPTSIEFRWGTDAAALATSPPPAGVTVTAVPGTIGATSDPSGPSAGARDVSAAVTGLTAGTTYYVAARATNRNGTTIGATATFTTPLTDTPTPTPTPAATPTPTATPSPVPPPPTDFTAPTVGLTLLTRKRASLISDGLKATVGLSEPGSIAVAAYDAKRRQVTRASSGLATLRNGGSQMITITLTPAAKLKLRRGGKVRWTVEATGIDATGNQRTVSVPFTLG